MIITLCLNPVLQKTLCFSTNIQVNAVNRAVSHRLDASGKGINVSRVLQQLGSPAVHITQLGGSFAYIFRSLCKEDAIPLDFVPVRSEIRFCYTIIDSGVTEAVEEGNTVEQNTEKKIQKKVHTYLRSNKTSALVLSGTKAPGFSSDLYPGIVLSYLQKEIPVIADFRGDDLIAALESIKKSKHRSSLLTIKPNAEELCSTFLCRNTEHDIKDCIESISKKYGCNCIITQGDKPVFAHTAEGFSSFAVTKELNPKNTTGCGDAFTAGFAAVISNGGSFTDAVHNGLVCGKKNAGTIRPGSIL